MKPTMQDYLEAIDEVNKSDIPAYLRKAKGEKPLTKAELDAEREKNISHPKTIAKNSGVSEAVNQQAAGDDSMPNGGPEQTCSKCGKNPCECDSVKEELKGGQVKLDKNKNGKLDADDFKKLRQEQSDVPFDPPYSTDFKKVKNPNRTGMDAARALSRRFLQKSKKTPVISGHEKFTSTPDNLKPEHFGKQFEEVELTEASHRDMAAAGLMHPDMAKHMTPGHEMDFYAHGTGDKMSGKVLKNTGKEVHIQTTLNPYKEKDSSVHKFKIATHLPEEVQIDEGDLSIRHLYNKFADAEANGRDTKPTEKAIRKVHGDEVFKHMKKASRANAKGDFDGEERHFDNAQTAGNKTDRIGGTVGRGRSEFMRKRREWSEEVQIDEVLTVSMGVSKWIHDFVHSTNPKFKGKSVKERQRMALGAFYAAKKGLGEGYESPLDTPAAKAAREKLKQTLLDIKKKNPNHPAVQDVQEETEQIDELSKATLGSYIKKASVDLANKGVELGKKRADSDEVDRYTNRHMPDQFGARETMKKAVGASGEEQNKVQSKLIKRNKNVGKATDRLTKESTEYVTPYVKTQNYTWGKMKTIHHGSAFSIPLHPEHHEAIAKLEDQQEHHFKDETGRHWTAKRDGHNVHFQGANGGNSTTVSHTSMREETETMHTFKQFLQAIEEGHDYSSGRYVHKGKYGTSYDDPEGKEDDEKAEKPKAEKAVKRGRGRPAGSKSGARQLGGASKGGNQADYTGYKLHLPNSNKSY